MYVFISALIPIFARRLYTFESFLLVLLVFNNNALFISGEKEHVTLSEIEWAIRPLMQRILYIYILKHAHCFKFY